MTEQERKDLDPEKSTVSFDPKTVPSDEEPSVKISPSPTVIGIVTGIILSVYLALINVALASPSMGTKIFKYIILGGILTWALVKVERLFSPQRFVQNSLITAGYICGIAAVIVAVANLAFYSINPDWGFEKFADADGTGITAFSYSGIQLFEIFAIGMIIAFILIQFLKGRSGSEKV